MVKKMRIGQLQAAALTTHRPARHRARRASGRRADDDRFVADARLRHGCAWRPSSSASSMPRATSCSAGARSGSCASSRPRSTRRWREMQNAKMFCWEGDPASAEAWRVGGFHPVVMSSTDIVPGLQTGLIDTVAMAPLYAYSSRMFEKAKFMLDMPWTVLTGAHRRAQGRVGQGAGRHQAQAHRDLARVLEEDRRRGAAHGQRGAREHGQAGARRGEADRSGRRSPRRRRRPTRSSAARSCRPRRSTRCASSSRRRGRSRPRSSEATPDARTPARRRRRR